MSANGLRSAGRGGNSRTGRLMFRRPPSLNCGPPHANLHEGSLPGLRIVGETILLCIEIFPTAG